MLLPRDVAQFTRRGVEFRTLYYKSDELFHGFVDAGVMGKKKATVAFDPLNDEQIFLVEDGIIQ